MKENIKFMVYIAVGTILIVLLFGYFQYNYLNEKINKDFTNKFNMFQAGYNDGTIQDISQMIVECTPDNVEVFNFIDLKPQHVGIIFKCLKNNETRTMKFSSFYGGYRELG